MNFNWEEWYAAVDPMVDAMEYPESNISVAIAEATLKQLPSEMHDAINFGTHTEINCGLFGRILQVLPVTFKRPYVFRLSDDGAYAEILVLKDDMHLLFTIDDSSYVKYKLLYALRSTFHGVEIEGGAHVTRRRGRAPILKKLLNLLEV